MYCDCAHPDDGCSVKRIVFPNFMAGKIQHFEPRALRVQELVSTSQSLVTEK